MKFVARRQHIIGWLACSCWIVLLLWASAIPSKALINIIPGHALGKIRIGETRQDVLASFPRGPENNYDLKHGLSEDEWITPIPSKYGSDSTYLSIWYKHGRVVQIEYSNKSESHLGLPSFSRLIANNKNLKKACYSMGCYTGDGEPAGGYIQFYFDDIKAGIAYGAGVQDSFILTTTPDTITIHAPGSPVIPYRGLTNVSVVTGVGAATYRSWADAERADKQSEMAEQRKLKKKN